MSEHIFTFKGVPGPVPWNVISVPGTQAGDKVLEVVAVSGDAGDFTTGFSSYIPVSGIILQGGADYSANIFLMRIERNDS